MKAAHLTRAKMAQTIGFHLLRLVTLITIIPIIGLVVYIVVKGAPAISWEFLTAAPSNGMREGGIFPAIVGTLYLTLGTALFSVPIGVLAGIYLAEYAQETAFTRIIRIAIINLAGIPSVVYGLFGLGLFVLFLHLGTSILAASLTLSIMTLPVIISTTEGALRSVPNSSGWSPPRWAQRAGRPSAVLRCRKPCPGSSPASFWGWNALPVKPRQFFSLAPPSSYRNYRARR